MFDVPSVARHLRVVRCSLEGERILGRLDVWAATFLIGRCDQVTALLEEGSITPGRAAAEAVHLRTASSLFAPLPAMIGEPCDARR